MISLNSLCSFLGNTLLQKPYADNSLNGLQVEGKSEVQRLAVAVDAGLSVVESAVAHRADFLFVHHGIFWGDSYALTGPSGHLVKTLFDAGLSLYACHIPLDAHPEYGNNFVLARSLGLNNLVEAIEWKGLRIGCCGENQAGKSLQDFLVELKTLPGASTNMLSLNFGPTIPKRVCVVTGSAADSLYAFDRDNFDTLITGEPRQAVFHFAKDNKLNAIFAGHYATETVGVCEIGKLIQKKFSLPFDFIDQPTGI